MVCQHRNICATITDLEINFGPKSTDIDNYKVTHKWFVEFQDRMFYIYNWKATSIYSPEFMPPETFDQIYRNIPYNWCVSSLSNAPMDEFIQYLLTLDGFSDCVERDERFSEIRLMMYSNDVPEAEEIINSGFAGTDIILARGVTALT